MSSSMLPFGFDWTRSCPSSQGFFWRNSPRVRPLRCGGIGVNGTHVSVLSLSLSLSLRAIYSPSLCSFGRVANCEACTSKVSKAKGWRALRGSSMCSTRSMVATGVSLGAPRRAPSRGATRVHARPRKAGRSDNRKRRETLLHRRGKRNGLTFRRNAQAEEQAGKSKRATEDTASLSRLVSLSAKPFDRGLARVFAGLPLTSPLLSSFPPCEGAPLAPCITLTDNALAHLTQLKGQKAVPSDSERNKLLLRIGVKQGGCSGMSYFMDFETPDQVVDDDAVMELEGDMKLGELRPDPTRRCPSAAPSFPPTDRFPSLPPSLPHSLITAPVCDPKSLLYLFGMELDYSNELIGGGFKFSNPNADSTCGCGKSFSV